MSARRILLVEDDPEIRTLLATFLEREGFAVDVAEGGKAMDEVLSQRTPDLVVLDLMLPGEDGLSICRRLRARGRMGILILTAKDEDVDRIVGLELGADDYLGKPFNPRELLARARAILRRSTPDGTAPRDPHRRMAFAGFILDLDSRLLTNTAGERITLTTTEFELLACFVEHPQRVLSRELLLDWTRGRSATPFDRTIDVSVSRRRRKLGDPASPASELITTVRNGGYLFAAEVRAL